MTYTKRRQSWVRVSVLPDIVTPPCNYLVLAASSFLKMQIMPLLYLFISVYVSLLI